MNELDENLVVLSATAPCGDMLPDPGHRAAAVDYLADNCPDRASSSIP